MVSNRYHICILIFLFGGIILSCDSDDTDAFFVEPEIQVYFDRFESEGRARGLVVNFDSVQISGIFTSFLGPNILGTCQLEENEFNRIQINLFYWERANDRDREFLVFHELGHCYLGRPHLETAFPNQDCRSIMASGTGTCNQNYNQSTRSDYLDELFNL